MIKTLIYNLCSKMAGNIYKFKNQLLTTYEDSLKFMGNPPFAAYLNFETTVGSSSKILMNEPGMCPMSYCLIFAFHPKLKIDRIVVMSSFSHLLERLTDVSYLSKKMLENMDPITEKQTKVAIRVWLSQRSVSEKIQKKIFSTQYIFKTKMQERKAITIQINV